MANPNYPPMGQMPPMGGPPMGPPMGGPPSPMGGPPMQMHRPMRRGTSKAVPVVVSAGLAIGVFCGLLFGVGTGKDEAHASPAKGNNVKPPPEEPKPDPGAAPAGLGATTAAPVKPAVAAGSAAPAAGSAAPVAAGSAAPAAGSAAPTVAEPKTIKVTFLPKPDAAAKDAKISIDGKEIEGNVAEIPADTKSVKVEVKASGYRTYEKKLDIMGGDMNVEFDMVKRSSGSNIRPPKRPDRPPSGGGGLIDI